MRNKATLGDGVQVRCDIFKLTEISDCLLNGDSVPVEIPKSFIRFLEPFNGGKKSADDTGDAMETFSLAVGTFHSIGLCKVHPFGHPAFRTVGKRGRFYKCTPNPKFPAVDTESAAIEWFLLFGKALDPSSGGR